MDAEVWRNLSLLESRDHVQRIFRDLHGRQLNLSRTTQINFASKQAKEFFKSAFASDYSVRPLLAFYGVVSLSRSLALVLMRASGEDALTKGHGLVPVGWTEVLNGAISEGLARLGDLRTRACGGMFTDLIEHTQNKLCLHINSSAVDWRLSYPVPQDRFEISALSLWSRIPDLHPDLVRCTGASPRYASVNTLTYSREGGLNAKVLTEEFLPLRSGYEAKGYFVGDANGRLTELRATPSIFSNSRAYFLNNYLSMSYFPVPRLAIVEPFDRDLKLSQLACVYLVSYLNGMLARYYPTHWVALERGEKGGRIWPLIRRSQDYVEQIFPFLAWELLNTEHQTAVKRRSKEGTVI